MGKAKRELIEARKAIYETPEESTLQEYDNINKKIENDNIVREDTAVLLRKRLMQYSSNAGLSLCEHLDLENVDSFIQWVLKNT